MKSELLLGAEKFELAFVAFPANSYARLAGDFSTNISQHPEGVQTSNLNGKKANEPKVAVRLLRFPV